MQRWGCSLDLGTVGHSMWWGGQECKIQYFRVLNGHSVARLDTTALTIVLVYGLGAHITYTGSPCPHICGIYAHRERRALVCRGIHAMYTTSS